MSICFSIPEVEISTVITINKDALNIPPKTHPINFRIFFIDFISFSLHPNVAAQGASLRELPWGGWLARLDLRPFLLEVSKSQTCSSCV
jgi:hypothetical protein